MLKNMIGQYIDQYTDSFIKYFQPNANEQQKKGFKDHVWSYYPMLRDEYFAKVFPIYQRALARLGDDQLYNALVLGYRYDTCCCFLYPQPTQSEFQRSVDEIQSAVASVEEGLAAGSTDSSTKAMEESNEANLYIKGMVKNICKSLCLHYLEPPLKDSESAQNTVQTSDSKQEKASEYLDFEEQLKPSKSDPSIYADLIFETTRQLIVDCSQAIENQLASLGYPENTSDLSTVQSSKTISKSDVCDSKKTAKKGSPQQDEPQVDQVGEGAAISGLRKADDSTAGPGSRTKQQITDLRKKQSSALPAKDHPKKKQPDSSSAPNKISLNNPHPSPLPTTKKRKQPSSAATAKKDSPQQVKAQVDQVGEGAAISGLRKADNSTAGPGSRAKQQITDLHKKQSSALSVKDHPKKKQPDSSSVPNKISLNNPYPSPLPTVKKRKQPSSAVVTSNLSNITSKNPIFSYPNPNPTSKSGHVNAAFCKAVATCIQKNVQENGITYTYVTSKERIREIAAPCGADPLFVYQYVKAIELISKFPEHSLAHFNKVNPLALKTIMQFIQDQ